MIPDSVAVLLLLGLLAALYALYAQRGGYERGWFDGNQHAVQKMVAQTTPLVQWANAAGETLAEVDARGRFRENKVYDYEKDGL